jgi:short-subunit dehydrogenase
VAADLASDLGLEAVRAQTRDLEVGLVVANAAYSPIGPFLSMPADQTRRALDLNCGATLWLAHEFLPPMAARGRGGMIVMSSLAGNQGSPPISVYAATKAFGAILAEGLWQELRGTGVDVLTCVAGAVATPGLAGAMARPAPGTQTPAQVAMAALDGLGRGPRVVPGALMRVSSALMARLLPRRTSIALMARASKDLQG